MIKLSEIRLPSNMRIDEVHGGKQLVFIDKEGNIVHRSPYIFSCLTGHENKALANYIESGLKAGKFDLTLPPVRDFMNEP